MTNDNVNVEFLVRQSQDLVNRINPILEGKDGGIVGAALCHLSATWLAAHFVEGDVQETDQMREEMLTLHITQLRKLTIINAKALGTPYSEGFAK